MTSYKSYAFKLSDSLIGLQMLLVGFGALILVPLLTGLDPRVALFTAGCGTLIFQFITKGQVPIFLGSSFAFIAPIIYGIQHWGLQATLGGMVAAGMLYIPLSLLIRWKGLPILYKLFPPIVTGPVIMVIGLVLAPIAVNMALGRSADGKQQIMSEDIALFLALITLTSTIIIFLYAKGYFRSIQIMIGLTIGYVCAYILGIIDYSEVVSANWFSLIHFTFPTFHWEAVLFLAPIAIAPIIEHFGDMIAIGQVTNKDFLQKPGIDKTLIGDGFATIFAASLGGPPNTTYSEITGAVALTKKFNPAVMTWAALFAITLAFSEKFGALLETIPLPVMGGILLIVFGTITVVGLNCLLQVKDNIMLPRNMIIISIVLVFGIGGMALTLDELLVLKGIGLSAIVGVILNLILPKTDTPSKLPKI